MIKVYSVLIIREISTYEIADIVKNYQAETFFAMS